MVPLNDHSVDEFYSGNLNIIVFLFELSYIKRQSEFCTE